jgi:hypothetical protein
MVQSGVKHLFMSKKVQNVGFYYFYWQKNSESWTAEKDVESWEVWCFKI